MFQDIDNDFIIAGVYIILHITSGKAYVGQSINIKGRWKSHFKNLSKNCHNNNYLQAAWNKYGPEEFQFKIFLKVEENLSSYLLQKELKRLEIEVLKLFPQHYNLTDAGEGAMILSESSKRKMGKSIKQNWEDNEDTRKKHNFLIKAAWLDPKLKASRIAAFNTPEGKKNRARGASKGWEKRRIKLQNDATFLEKHKASREKANKKIQKLYNTPKRKRLLSKQAYETWSIQERKEKVSASLKKFYSNPENRKIHSERMKKNPPFSKNPKKKLTTTSSIAPDL